MPRTQDPGNNMATFHIETFGCQMNVRDSAWLAAALQKRGHMPQAPDAADIVILNTCSVRHKPDRKALDAIARLWSARGNSILVAVLGCVAQQMGEKLLAASRAVRLVAGGDNVAAVPDALTRLLADRNLKLTLLDFSPRYEEREEAPETCAAASAFVNIMQGCDNFCSYCIVPFTRGRQKSRGWAEVLRECRFWIERGACEITLLGQNVNVWSDGQGGAFAHLLREIAALPGLARLRFVTPHPADMGEDVIACFAELPNLCPRLHLPLQSGSDAILKAMRRRHSRADYLRLVEKLRKARPDLALSTDIIAGFPGETDADFEDTLTMMAQCGFMASYSFAYSDRPGARSALMPDKIDEGAKLARLKRLQKYQDELTSAWLAGRTGGRAEILLERPSPRGGANSWQGRDVYGACVNIVTAAGAPGKLVPARITAAKKHSLTGEALD